MNNGDKKEWIESLYTEEKFLFTYNSIINNNPNLSYNIK